MESDKIEKLLEAYFEGTTNLEEETLLRDYFSNNDVPEHFANYTPIFIGLKAAKEERSSREFKVPEAKVKSNNTLWYSMAAVFVVSFGVASFYFSKPNYTQEEQEALAAFEKSKKTMMLLSENLNKGAEQLTFVQQFGITKDKIFD